MPRSIILSLTLIAAPLLIGQTVHTTADTQQREAKLLATAKAAPTGLGTDIMDDYGNDRTLLVVRVHSGDPERHQFWADEMVVKKGTITLVTGGTLQGEHPNGTAPGETLGTSIQGGRGTDLAPLTGALLIGVITSGVVVLGVAGVWFQFVYGALILLAVARDRLWQSRKVSRSGG